MKIVTIVMCVVLMIMMLIDSLPKKHMKSIKRPNIYINDSGVMFIEFGGRQIVM